MSSTERIIAWLGILLSSADFAAAQTREDLAIMVRAYRQHFAGIEYRQIEYFREVTPQTSRPTLGLEFRIGDFKVVGRSEYGDVRLWSDELQERPSIHQVTYSNGQISKKYQPLLKKGLVANGHRKEVGQFNYPFTLMMWPVNESEVRDVEARLEKDLLTLLESQEVPIEITSDSLDAEPMIKVNLNDMLLVWIDVAKGAVPRRMERLMYPGGPPFLIFEITELHEMDGFFFPSKAKKITYAPDESATDATVVWAESIFEYPIDFITYGDVLESELDLEFPVGTEVTDRIVNSSYIVGRSEIVRADLLDEIFSDDVDQILNAHSNPSHQRDLHRPDEFSRTQLTTNIEKRNSLLAIFAGTVILMLAALSGLIIYRRFRKS